MLSAHVVPPEIPGEEFDVRLARNIEDTRRIWWPFMQKLGWNRAIFDLATYVNASRSPGMHLLFPKGDSTPIGHVAAVINTNSTGWVSWLIVDDAFRDHGLGGLLMNAAAQDFSANRVRIIGCDAVPERKATNERAGFVDSGLGVLMTMTRPLAEKRAVNASAEVEVTSTTHLVSLDSLPHHLIAEHEFRCTGFERRNLWNEKNMFGRPDVLGWALVAKAKPDKVEDIFAWSMVRRCSSGARIGPVYARDAEAAKVVLAAAVKTASAEYIKAIPMENEPMSSWPNSEIIGKASLVAEVWTGNKEAIGAFEQLGWSVAKVGYHRMWLDGKATTEQSEGGLAQTRLFAAFDATIG